MLSYLYFGLFSVGSCAALAFYRLHKKKSLLLDKNVLFPALPLESALGNLIQPSVEPAVSFVSEALKPVKKLLQFHPVHAFGFEFYEVMLINHLSVGWISQEHAIDPFSCFYCDGTPHVKPLTTLRPSLDHAKTWLKQCAGVA